MKAVETEALLWKALADPTRRQILDQLRRAPMRAGLLAERFEMTRFGVRKHLNLLERAGLVIRESRGRERWLHLNPVPLREIHGRWIRSFELEAADQLLRIQRLSESLSKHPPMIDSPSNTAQFRDVIVEVSIDAPRQSVWQALVDHTNAWWHSDYYTAPNPLGFHIEPKLGGMMFEDWGAGAGQVWGQVMGLRPGEYLQVMGDSSRDWGGPSRNIMTWRLSEAAGKTKLRFENSIFGKVDDATAASLDQGWQQLFGECLKPYVEAELSAST